ncbi:MAG TPA: hypothetical protein VFJ62_07395 [Usitatibacter sp.]|nr:hypothetical protein [Usitatibacter sp.]
MNDWRAFLVIAPTEEDVIRLTREYVATWGPEQIAHLPAECRPGRIRDGEDIGQWAYELAQAHCSLRFAEDDDRLVASLLAFTAEAVARIAEVRTRHVMETT